MKVTNSDRVLLALLNAGEEGLTGAALRAQLGLSGDGFTNAIARARRKAAEDLGAIIPRSVYPDYVYRLVDKDNPNVPAFKDGVRIDTADMITRLVRIHRDAETMRLVVDGRTRDGKLVHIIAKQIGRACEDIADARDELVLTA